MNQTAVLLCAACCVLAAAVAAPAPRAKADSAGVPPLPGPGFSYGGIPYGSMSGNVAEYFKHQAPSSGRSANFAGYSTGAVNYAPIEQWL